MSLLLLLGALARCVHIARLRLVVFLIYKCSATFVNSDCCCVCFAVHKVVFRILCLVPVPSLKMEGEFLIVDLIITWFRVN